ncbi:uncharacterized protein LOC133531136 [Cydia pomonella]|uniref:uncharacterized protein LOC133531136 n=1 Tax=Cydia pomonella TaxID=82600 RepID=UPI002ADD9DEE|nr:uncharacterized protein LOC133531136 [Cydia pomonella]
MRTALLLFALALGQGWIKCNLFDPKNGMNTHDSILRRHSKLSFVKNTDSSRKRELQNKEKQLIAFFKHALHQEHIMSEPKMKKTKLRFSLAGFAKGIQFVADVVTIVSSDFWKWIRTVK